ncbi:MAG: hypothetical protein J2O48_01425 [Solirubrobacterales bacterium]|nr:hypothetical protein [Solirubrobacterales bacterium]
MEIPHGWVEAVNAHDAAVANSYRGTSVSAPERYPNAAGWPSQISDLKCRTISQTRTRAELACNFRAYNWENDGHMDNVTNWGFWLRRYPRRGWLIDGYGNP